MIAESFVVAMRANLHFGAYEQPFHAGDPVQDWVIVSRWGPNAEYLTVSRTDSPPNGDHDAPLGLVPRATFFGLLAWADADANESVFLLVRRLPPGLPVAGVFHPTDGFARLSGAGKPARLVAAGRYAHVHGSGGGLELRGDVPDPPDAAEHAASWRMTAERHNWIGEVPE